MKMEKCHIAFCSSSSSKAIGFDRGELRLAKDKQDDDIRWLDFDPFGKDAESLSVESEGKE